MGCSRNFMPDLPQEGLLQQWQQGATRHPYEPKTRHSTEYYNERNPTCFQRSCPTPYVPIPLPRKRSNPTSIVRSKTISVARRTMMLSLMLSALRTVHCTATKSQLARIWRLVRLEDPKYWELLIHPRDA